MNHFTMRTSVFRIVLGILASVLVMAVLGGFFFFLNPLGIHEVNRLRWVPILITGVGLSVGSRLNRRTPLPWLLFLLLPIVLWKPFHFLYIPFVFSLVAAGVLAILANQSRLARPYRLAALSGWVVLFLVYLFSQPLVIRQDGFTYHPDGSYEHALVLWDFPDDSLSKLPDHDLRNVHGQTVNFRDLKGKTHFVTFWATWCAPCMRDKPQLEALKQTLANDTTVQFVDISFDESTETWLTYLKEHDPTGRQWFAKDQGAASRALHFSGIPMHLIIDKQGHYVKIRPFDRAREGLLERVGRE
jgi:thiol-disulfide isomerase/thioredoxin